MPAGRVRPKASQAPVMGAGAVADYRAQGWTVRDGRHGRIIARDDDTTGPCALCGAACVRYGDQGGPLCPLCSEVKRGALAAADG